MCFAGPPDVAADQEGSLKVTLFRLHRSNLYITPFCPSVPTTATSYRQVVPSYEKSVTVAVCVGLMTWPSRKLLPQLSEAEGPTYSSEIANEVLFTTVTSPGAASAGMAA